MSALYYILLCLMICINNRINSIKVFDDITDGDYVFWRKVDSPIELMNQINVDDSQLYIEAGVNITVLNSGINVINNGILNILGSDSAPVNIESMNYTDQSIIVNCDVSSYLNIHYVNIYGDMYDGIISESPNTYMNNISITGGKNVSFNINNSIHMNQISNIDIDYGSMVKLHGINITVMNTRFVNIYNCVHCVFVNNNYINSEYIRNSFLTNNKYITFTRAWDSVFMANEYVECSDFMFNSDIMGPADVCLHTANTGNDPSSIFNTSISMCTYGINATNNITLTFVNITDNDIGIVFSNNSKRLSISADTFMNNSNWNIMVQTPHNIHIDDRGHLIVEVDTIYDGLYDCSLGIVEVFNILLRSQNFISKCNKYKCNVEVESDWFIEQNYTIIGYLKVTTGNISIIADDYVQLKFSEYSKLIVIGLENAQIELINVNIDAPNIQLKYVNFYGNNNVNLIAQNYDMQFVKLDGLNSIVLNQGTVFNSTFSNIVSISGSNSKTTILNSSYFTNITSGIRNVGLYNSIIEHSFGIISSVIFNCVISNNVIGLINGNHIENSVIVNNLIGIAATSATIMNTVICDNRWNLYNVYPPDYFAPMPILPIIWSGSLNISAFYKTVLIYKDRHVLKLSQDVLLSEPPAFLDNKSICKTKREDLFNGIVSSNMTISEHSIVNIDIPYYIQSGVRLTILHNVTINVLLPLVSIFVIERGGELILLGKPGEEIKIFPHYDRNIKIYEQSVLFEVNGYLMMKHVDIGYFKAGIGSYCSPNYGCLMGKINMEYVNIDSISHFVANSTSLSNVNVTTGYIRVWSLQTTNVNVTTGHLFASSFHAIENSTFKILGKKESSLGGCKILNEECNVLNSYFLGVNDTDAVSLIITRTVLKYCAFNNIKLISLHSSLQNTVIFNSKSIGLQIDRRQSWIKKRSLENVTIVNNKIGIHGSERYQTLGGVTVCDNTVWNLEIERVYEYNDLYLRPNFSNIYWGNTNNITVIRSKIFDYFWDTRFSPVIIEPLPDINEVHIWNPYIHLNREWTVPDISECVPLKTVTPNYDSSRLVYENLNGYLQVSEPFLIMNDISIDPGTYIEVTNTNISSVFQIAPSVHNLNLTGLANNPIVIKCSHCKQTSIFDCSVENRNIRMTNVIVEGPFLNISSSCFVNISKSTIDSVTNLIGKYVIEESNLIDVKQFVYCKRFAHRYTYIVQECLKNMYVKNVKQTTISCAINTTFEASPINIKRGVYNHPTMLRGCLIFGKVTTAITSNHYVEIRDSIIKDAVVGVNVVGVSLNNVRISECKIGIIATEINFDILEICNNAFFNIQMNKWDISKSEDRGKLRGHNVYFGDNFIDENRVRSYIKDIFYDASLLLASFYQLNDHSTAPLNSVFVTHSVLNITIFNELGIINITECEPSNIRPNFDYKNPPSRAIINGVRNYTEEDNKHLLTVINSTLYVNPGTCIYQSRLRASDSRIILSSAEAMIHVKYSNWRLTESLLDMNFVNWTNSTLIYYRRDTDYQTKIDNCIFSNCEALELNTDRPINNTAFSFIQILSASMVSNSTISHVHHLSIVHVQRTKIEYVDSGDLGYLDLCLAKDSNFSAGTLQSTIVSNSHIIANEVRDSLIINSNICGRPESYRVKAIRLHGWYSTFINSNITVYTLHNCTICRSYLQSVSSYQEFADVFRTTELTNNYFGTTNRSIIRSFITDGWRDPRIFDSNPHPLPLMFVVLDNIIEEVPTIYNLPYDFPEQWNNEIETLLPSKCKPLEGADDNLLVVSDEVVIQSHTVLNDVLIVSTGNLILNEGIQIKGTLKLMEGGILTADGSIDYPIVIEGSTLIYGKFNGSFIVFKSRCWLYGAEAINIKYSIFEGELKSKEFYRNLTQNCSIETSIFNISKISQCTVRNSDFVSKLDIDIYRAINCSFKNIGRLGVHIIEDSDVYNISGNMIVRSRSKHTVFVNVNNGIQHLDCKRRKFCNLRGYNAIMSNCKVVGPSKYGVVGFSTIENSSISNTKIGIVASATAVLRHVTLVNNEIGIQLTNLVNGGNECPIILNWHFLNIYCNDVWNIYLDDNIQCKNIQLELSSIYFGTTNITNIRSYIYDILHNQQSSYLSLIGKEATKIPFDVYPNTPGVSSRLTETSSLALIRPLTTIMWECKYKMNRREDFRNMLIIDENTIITESITFYKPVLILSNTMLEFVAGITIESFANPMFIVIEGTISLIGSSTNLIVINGHGNTFVKCVSCSIESAYTIFNNVTHNHVASDDGRSLEFANCQMIGATFNFVSADVYIYNTLIKGINNKSTEFQGSNMQMENSRLQDIRTVYVNRSGIINSIIENRTIIFVDIRSEFVLSNSYFEYSRLENFGLFSVSNSNVSNSNIIGITIVNVGAGYHEYSSVVNSNIKHCVDIMFSAVTTSGNNFWNNSKIHMLRLNIFTNNTVYMVNKTVFVEVNQDDIIYSQFEDVKGLITLRSNAIKHCRFFSNTDVLINGDISFSYFFKNSGSVIIDGRYTQNVPIHIENVQIIGGQGMSCNRDMRILIRNADIIESESYGIELGNNRRDYYAPYIIFERVSIMHNHIGISIFKKSDYQHYPLLQNVNVIGSESFNINGTFTKDWILNSNIFWGTSSNQIISSKLNSSKCGDFCIPYSYHALLKPFYTMNSVHIQKGFKATWFFKCMLDSSAIVYSKIVSSSPESCINLVLPNHNEVSSYGIYGPISIQSDSDVECISIVLFQCTNDQKVSYNEFLGINTNATQEPPPIKPQPAAIVKSNVIHVIIILILIVLVVFVFQWIYSIIRQRRRSVPYVVLPQIANGDVDIELENVQS